MEASQLQLQVGTRWFSCCLPVPARRRERREALAVPEHHLGKLLRGKSFRPMPLGESERMPRAVNNLHW